MKTIKSIITATLLLLASSFIFSTSAQEVIELNKQQFLEKVWNYETNPEAWKYNGTLPCVIDFNAKWCGPCRQMNPILNDMAAKYAGKVIIYKVNVDKEQELSALFGISSIPAFLFCPVDGDPRGTVGAYPANEFEKLIRTVLLGEKVE
ncbi:MAG: thiol reductase thioredoxin [Bacteroidales bacterium]|nr:thiol reductase thioredoxin [Bacteroidales bacterium]